jgi:nitroreductase
MSSPIHRNGLNSAIERLRPLIRTRQIRHYNSEPVADEDLLALLEVARWSGSSRNSQPCRFIVVNDVALIRRMAEIGHPQTRALGTAMAAIAITLPAEDGRAISLAYDDGRVAERVLIGASMVGLGSGITWVRSDVREAIGELLGVESGRFVRTIMAIGHPSAEGLARRSAQGEARLPLDELVTRR